jgi:membrane protein
LAINIYVKILMLIQTTMVTRMSIFYGSLAFLPLMLFLIFGVWSIILCGNSLVWTICHWPEAAQKTWNWKATLEDVHNGKQSGSEDEQA